MEYSIRELSELAGVSARTLRYYDEIGLLNPLYVNDAGYRFYGEKELAILQQILFYRERRFELKEIHKILYQEDFDIMNALQEHLLELEEQRRRMDALIQTVKQTIRSMKGECEMTDNEKFEAFKAQRVKENEEKYGAEIRAQFGEEEMDEANKKALSMTEEEWEKFQNLESEIYSRLKECVLKDISPESEEAKRIVILHREWLGKTWKKYTKEAHRAIAVSYISDERFRRYYDREISGCAQWLGKAVCYWTDKI